ncbi:hypothetical protein MMC18_007492 [Xylographa bjoerkii]|nr:hypothetical protein [Xylographa bjoerkii]
MGPISETWHDLQQLFDAHPPVLTGERAAPGRLTKDFQSSIVKYPLPNSAAEASILRGIHQHLVARIPTRPPLDLYNGRGIVMLAGQSRDEYAGVSLGMLRLVGGRLPVELWFLDRASAKTSWCPQLVAKGVTCRFLSEYTANLSQTFPFEEQQRAAVLLFSSFQHALYLHSDTIPVLNPDNTFDSQPYRDTGLIAWPDFWQSSQSGYADFITGARAEIMPERIDYGTIDPTQLEWDKERQWKLLVLVLYYNYYPSFFHPLLQDFPTRSFASTISTALRALQVPYTSMPSLTPVPMSAPDGGPEGSGVCVFQVSPSDPQLSQYMFLHTSIHRFGLRDLMCDETCVEESPVGYERPTKYQRIIGTTVRTVGAVATTTDPLYGRLRHKQEMRRVLAWEDLEARGLDPEQDIWRVLERMACEPRSVWNQGALCSNVRNYMSGTFSNVEYWRGEC